MRNFKKHYAILCTIFLSLTAVSIGFISINLASNNFIKTTYIISGPKSSATYNTSIVIDETNPAEDWETAKVAGISTGSGTSGQS